jgi:hypothetical protein
VRVLPVLLALFESLRRAGVRYCHWKSNWRLAETLRGETDLDLLVHRTDMARFLAVAGALGFKPGSGEDHPSVWHFYGCDDESNARSSELEFAGVPTYRIRTDTMVEETVRAVKPILWNAL